MSCTEFIVLKQMQKSMLRYGRSIDLPKGTDITKTYGWRNLTSYINNLKQLNISLDDSQIIINSLIDYAYEHKILGRGFAILSNSNLLKIAINAIQKDLKNKYNRMSSIERAKNFLNSQVIDSNIDDILSKRIKMGSYTNLTRWFEQGHISTEYIACSKACVMVMNNLDSNERSVLPKPIDLLKTKHKVLTRESTDKVIALMGDDFNPPSK